MVLILGWTFLSSCSVVIRTLNYFKTVWWVWICKFMPNSWQLLPKHTTFYLIQSAWCMVRLAKLTVLLVAQKNLIRSTKDANNSTRRNRIVSLMEWYHVDKQQRLNRFIWSNCKYERNGEPDTSANTTPKDKTNLHSTFDMILGSKQDLKKSNRVSTWAEFLSLEVFLANVTDVVRSLIPNT